MTTPARSAVTAFSASGGGAGRALNRAAAAPGVIRGPGGHLDDRLMQSRLKEYVRATGRDIPVALNHAGRNASFKAVRRTPKTRLAQITADVGTVQSPSPKAFGIYMKNHPGTQLPGLAAKVKRMIASKRSSIAYIAAGFVMAIRAFASSTRRLNPKSLAARGHGLRAGPGRGYSEILNTAPGADDMAAAPLEVASVEALEDMMTYFSKNQNRFANRFNR